MARISFFDMLPSSLKQDKNMVAAALAIDAELERTEAMRENIIIKPNIDAQPENIVDNLAWELHVDFYEPLTMTVSMKRDLVKLSPDLHARNGTPSAVEDLVSAVFSEATIYEWYDYGGRPYFFKVTTTDAVTDAAQIELLIAAIFSVKNTRSWLEMIEVLRQIQAEIYFGGGVFTKARTTISPKYAEPEPEPTVWHYVGLVYPRFPMVIVEGE